MKVVLAFSLLLPIWAGWGQELLTNPGFEDGSAGTAPGWSLLAWGEEKPQVALRRESAGCREGQNCQLVEVTALPAKSGVILRQPFTFKQGRVYRAKLWVRSPGKTRVQVLMRRAGPHYEAGAIRGIEAGPRWQEVCIEGGFGDGDVEGFLGLSFRTPGTVMADGASLVDITAEVLSRPTPARRVPATFFGVHINKLGVHNVWPDLGAGLLRLWDTGTCWCHLQPEPDRWEWTRLDYYVRHVQRHAPAASILLTLGIPPAWAAAGAEGPKSKSKGTTTPPADLEHWRTYVRTLGQRYRGRIQYWEIWNESDYAGFYSGTPAQMLELARIAREELKSIDSANVVLSPNITRAGLAWLDEYLSLGGGQYADVISYHGYQTATPEHAVASYAGVQDLARAYGCGDKPVWNTEGAVEAKTGLSEDEAMGAVARAYLVQWAQGIENFNWYCWDIHWPGGANLSRELTGADVAAGGLAYRKVASWLTGAILTRRGVEGNTWRVELIMPDGGRALVVWNAAGESHYRLPGTWKAARGEDLRGRTWEIENGPVLAGCVPVLLREKP